MGLGQRMETVEIPEANVLEVLLPNPVGRQVGGAGEVERALREPIGAPRLSAIVQPGEKIAIITSDITRPCPSYAILPALLDELYLGGAKAEDITVVLALGSHRGHTEAERLHLLGERVCREVRCVDSNPDDCVHMGETRHGTPVDIDRRVAEADRRICVGNIEFHYFAGYSGGVKAIMPGVSTRRAIQVNHSMMVEDAAHAGRLEGNPLREDIEEAGRICRADYIVNVVLNEHKQILYAVAGDPVAAHRDGCRFLDTLYKKPIAERADIVIVSQGGAPKDLNLYQTQKALDNARHAVKDGGVVILVGSCREGLGERTFERWINEAQTPEDLVRRVHERFELGGHKAAAIAMVEARAEVCLVSEMDPELARKCFLTPFSALQPAFDYAFGKKGPDATVILMPYGGSTLPIAAE